MKKIALMALGFVAAMAAHASTQYNVRGTEYQADTLFHAMLGPGTSQTSLLMRSAEGCVLRENRPDQPLYLVQHGDGAGQLCRYRNGA